MNEHDPTPTPIDTPEPDASEPDTLGADDGGEHGGHDPNATSAGF